MARTNYVKSFRGQRKCQWTSSTESWGGFHPCGLPKGDLLGVTDNLPL